MTGQGKSGPGPRLVRALRGETVTPPPVWLMRQAGRYLPEYRELRAQAGGFLDLCYTPDLAVEVTLQPIRRFDLDAAILFSDILVIPDALGQPVRFVEGEGPRLDPLESPADLMKLSLYTLDNHLAPVLEAIRRLRAELPAEKALIGFAGAPWTLAGYMLEGKGGGGEFIAARAWAYAHPGAFQDLMDLLVDAITRFLGLQIEAGVDAVQLFDSWAGALPELQLRSWSLTPLAVIARRLKAKYPDVPVIVFPRKAGPTLTAYADVAEFDAISLDTSVPLAWARANIQRAKTVQGNLDPAVLIAGGRPLDEAVDRILAAFGDGPFVFNLGHGILPQTPPGHVERLVSRLRRAAAG
jgi:uroporphyrinogen decarboxylase